MPVHRNRIIYQSEALFVSPDSTGAHFTGAELTATNVGAHGAIGTEVRNHIGSGPFGLVTPPTGVTQAFGTNAGKTAPAKNAKGNILGWQASDTLAKWPDWNPEGTNSNFAQGHGSIIKQLKRIQTANYGFTVNRQDVNQFGHLGRLDSLIIEAPTVNLDFSYYLLDGYNERMLEFVTNGTINALSGALAPELYQAGNNFFILTVPEARDAVNGDVALESEDRENQKSVIALGNGFITDYTVDISVGAIPTASVTVEGMNIRSDFGTTGSDNPGIDINDGSLISKAWEVDADGVRSTYDGGCTGLYSLPASNSGYTGCNDISALRPGDVVVNMSNAAMISKQTSGTNASTNTLQGSAHIQSVSINVPMARTTLQRLGNTFGFSKAVDVPVNVSMTVSAVLADLKESNLIDLMCTCEGIEVGVDLYQPECGACELKQGEPAMRYLLKGARLESENFTSTIGDNKTVEVTFTSQVGGPDDPANGLFISGAEASNADVNGMPPAWTGLPGAMGKELPSDPVSGFLGYRG